MNKQDKGSGNRGVEYVSHTSNPVGGCFHDCEWDMPDKTRANCYASDAILLFELLALTWDAIKKDDRAAFQTDLRALRLLTNSSHPLVQAVAEAHHQVAQVALIQGRNEALARLLDQTGDALEGRSSGEREGKR